MTASLPDRPHLITGFPGLLAGQLLQEIAAEGQAPIHLLCLPAMADKARRQIQRLDQELPGLANRVQIHRGDITRPRLGLDETTYQSLTESIGLVWHLAALYDLAVENQIAFRVNLGGTYEVLDFCEAADDLIRLNYISTCYVSGTRRGEILESELDCGQRHHNHYESTKFWAEVEVQRRMATLPTAIFRPGIVVGDSRTGKTAKYDGPYFIFQLLHRLPQWMPFPNIGSGQAVVNLVPLDFVCTAIAHLGLHPKATSQVFQVADPHPMTARQIVDAVLRHLDRKPARGQLPPSWVEQALENKLVQAWSGIPPEALVYFNHDARYDTRATSAALQDTAIRCPHLSTYLPTLLDYFLRHPDSPPPLY